MANPIRPLQEAIYQAAAGSVPIKRMRAGGLEDTGEAYPVQDYMPPDVGSDYIAMESESVEVERVSKVAFRFLTEAVLVINSCARRPTTGATRWRDSRSRDTTSSSRPRASGASRRRTPPGGSRYRPR